MGSILTSHRARPSDGTWCPNRASAWVPSVLQIGERILVGRRHGARVEAGRGRPVPAAPQHSGEEDDHRGEAEERDGARGRGRTVGVVDDGCPQSSVTHAHTVMTRAPRSTSVSRTPLGPRVSREPVQPDEREAARDERDLAEHESPAGPPGTHRDPR